MTLNNEKCLELRRACVSFVHKCWLICWQAVMRSSFVLCVGLAMRWRSQRSRQWELWSRRSKLGIEPARSGCLNILSSPSFLLLYDPHMLDMHAYNFTTSTTVKLQFTQIHVHIAVKEITSFFIQHMRMSNYFYHRYNVCTSFFNQVIPQLFFSFNHMISLYTIGEKNHHLIFI